MTRQDQDQDKPAPRPRRSFKQRIRMLRPGAVPPKAHLRNNPPEEPVISSEERTFILDWDNMDIFRLPDTSEHGVADNQADADAVMDYLEQGDDLAGLDAISGQPPQEPQATPRTLDQLQAAVADQQETLLALIEEHDQLTHVICVNIQSDYMVKLGYLEIKAFDLSISYRRLKRELALTQARLNRGEPLDRTAIRAQLDREFAQFEAQLDSQLRSLSQALQASHRASMTPEEERDFKQTYRRLVKAWHPDLHPHQAPVDRQLFERAVVAYREGDIETMRVLGALLDKEAPADSATPDQADDVAEWQATYERNLTHIAHYQDKIQAIKTSYPYRYREVLEDPDLLAQRQQAAETLIARYRDGIAAYRARLAQRQDSGPDAAPGGAGHE